jgi:dihydrofolate reductase
MFCRRELPLDRWSSAAAQGQEADVGIVGVDKSMSLDGYITGPNPGPDNPLGDGGDRIFAWMMAEPADTTKREGAPLSDEWDEQFSDAFATTGAVIMGKRMFEIIDGPDGWVAPDGTPFPWPVFVLTHERRQPVTKGKTAFTFVNDGPASALAQARAVAGEKNIGVAGGNVVQQFLAAGLVDEITIHLVPVFLGGGVRLFDGLGEGPKQLECTNVRPGNGVTHLTYRLVRNS